MEEKKDDEPQEEESEEEITQKDFSRGPWMDPSNAEYRRGKQHAALLSEVKLGMEGSRSLENTETAIMVLCEALFPNDPETLLNLGFLRNPETWNSSCSRTASEPFGNSVSQIPQKLRIHLIPE